MFNETVIKVFAVIGVLVSVSAVIMVVGFYLAQVKADATEEAERMIEEMLPSHTSTAMDIIMAERLRQINEEGFNPTQDDRYKKDELAIAASCYLYAPVYPFDVSTGRKPPFQWPWLPSWWKPQCTRMRQLAKAGALVLAEMERQLRKQQKRNEERTQAS